ncbi:MAG: methyl-accepting chemotaxis protein [Deltaproteobacteria bacterium]
MGNRLPFRRRNYFIKKKFQVDFSVKFLIIILIEAFLAAGLFLYLSKGTLTTGYSGSELKIARTYDFFLPMLLLSNLIIVGISAVIGIAVLIFLSHRLAGPLYRFENILDTIKKGDLTQRFKLREKDQFVELANSINEHTDTLDKNMGHLKAGVMEFSQLISKMQTALTSNPSANKELERLLQEMSKKLQELEGAANYFKTS